MGNNKIGITAEFVSIMRSKNDSKNSYFVSTKSFRIYNLIKMIFSKKKLMEIFNWRLKLSEKFDERISEERPQQIIDLASGYSLRGFNLCLKNQNLVYIDSDLPKVVSRKKEVLNKICRHENINFPKNYFLIPIDVLKDDIFHKIKPLISSEKKTLIIAEGLTSYFNENEFALFIKNIDISLSSFSNGEFYSHENISQPNGFVYKILRSFISFLTHMKRRFNFTKLEEFENFLKNQNVRFKTRPMPEGFLFYSLFRSS
jgi:O-methyltransferase involved in polyketide biosynthesis